MLLRVEGSLSPTTRRSPIPSLVALSGERPGKPLERRDLAAELEPELSVPLPDDERDVPPAEQQACRSVQYLLTEPLEAHLGPTLR